MDAKEFSKYESLALSSMTNQEKTDYNNLSLDDKEQYVQGFKECIDEYVNVKSNKGNQSGQNQQNGMPLPDDGLDHWVSKKELEEIEDEQENGSSSKTNDVDFDDAEDKKSPKSNSSGDDSSDSSDDYDGESGTDSDTDNNSNSDNQNNDRQSEAQANKTRNEAQNADDAGYDAKESGDMAKEKAEEARLSGDSNDAQKAADAAKRAADKAKDAADKAQDAANQAQQAADQAKLNAEEALNKANQSGDPADQAAADQAKQDAENAQSAADQAKLNAENAQSAADQAAEAAEQSQQAANDAKNSTSASEERSATLQAADAAEQAGESAEQAGESAEQAGESAKQSADALDHNNEKGSNLNSIQNPGELSSNDNNRIDEQDMDFEEIDLDGDLNKDGLNIDDDLFPPDMDPQELMRKLAEEAGQDLDADDFVDPTEKQAENYEKIKSQLLNMRGAGQGFGNSLQALTDKISELFKSTLNWKAALKSLFNNVAKHGSEDIMAKRRMGVDASHPLYKGRYLHPNEERTDVTDGLTQVFFLIDNSGSMGFDGGEGQRYLKHLFSEIFDLERRTNILNSAIAYFGAGPIPERNIRRWTNKEVRNKTKLMEKIVRHAGDLGGGTSLATGLNSIMKLGKPYYNKKKPATLLIIVSDGYDSFQFIKDEFTTDLKNRCVFIILNSGKILEDTKDILVKQGIKSNHVLLADTKEWK